ncbi:uncharacterized protein LOC110824259 [Carica papaya]|uniref:uncharacterized protein LOC110824259 n=1 Tax=Carica papaya TaxID=3649 RepID=UPI000B8CFF2B|nr:uncharacterized protein LOC110824259 [Carica papaya]
MSFEPKGFWLPRSAECLPNGEITYDGSSRVESKRNHQWFMDITGSELLGNKKQAIGVNRPSLGVPHMNVPSWCNTSRFHSVSGQFTDQQFGSEPVGADRNITSDDNGNMNVGQKDFEEQYEHNSSISLSMSHTVEDPSSCLSFCGLRKVKVNQVKDSNNGMTAPLENYGRGDNSLAMGSNYRKNESNTTSLGPTYGNGENPISIAPAFSKASSNFISMSHTFGKGDASFMSMGHNYDKSTGNILSIAQSFDKGGGNFISMGQPYGKGDNNLISMGPSYSKGLESFISMAPSYNKADENIISVTPACNKEDRNTISMGPPYVKKDCTMEPFGRFQDARDTNILSMGQNYDKGEGSTISFGGFHDEPGANPPGSIISSYDLLMSSQNSDQVSEEPEPAHKEVAEENVDPEVNISLKPNAKAGAPRKNKDPKTAKMVSPNTFPSNVKSLLSTGIFDGVAVKYVSWSREKSLKGVIKGTGYLCGCNECNLSRPLNAYEFERHANCKTKHPNNHIYFENGKTIYSIVQELKNTPQENLFDAIQHITGSPINQKNFRSWKASFQAATRELQRIYGKDEASLISS